MILFAVLITSRNIHRQYWSGNGVVVSTAFQWRYFTLTCVNLCIQTKQPETGAVSLPGDKPQCISFYQHSQHSLQPISRWWWVLFSSPGRHQSNPTYPTHPTPHPSPSFATTKTNLMFGYIKPPRLLCYNPPPDDLWPYKWRAVPLFCTLNESTPATCAQALSEMEPRHTNMHKSMKNTLYHGRPAQNARTHFSVGWTAILSKMCQVEKEKQQQLGLDTESPVW